MKPPRECHKFCKFSLYFDPLQQHRNEEKRPKEWRAKELMDFLRQVAEELLCDHLRLLLLRLLLGLELDESNIICDAGIRNAYRRRARKKLEEKRVHGKVREHSRVYGKWREWQSPSEMGDPTVPTSTYNMRARRTVHTGERTRANQWAKRTDHESWWDDDDDDAWRKAKRERFQFISPSIYDLIPVY